MLRMELNLQKSSLMKEWGLEELQYSFVWEDFDLPRQAMSQIPGQIDKVLCIGGSGDNALSLLLSPIQELKIIDFNVAQIALIELKLAAIRSLEFCDFMSFFFEDSDKNLEIFDSLKSELSLSSLFYWNENINKIKIGIQFQGRLDVYFKKFRESALPLIWSKENFDHLISAKTIEEQLHYFDLGNQAILKKLTDDFFNKTSLSKAGRHSRQFKYVSTEETGKIFLNQFSNLIHKSLISKNLYLNYFLTGKPLDNKYTHPLWNEVSYRFIKKNLNKVSVLCEDLETYLMGSEIKYDYMNLSDLFEYISQSEADDLFNLISKKLNPGGVVSFWNLLVERRTSSGNLNYMKNISTSLTQNDRTFFYSGIHCYSRAGYFS